MAGCSIHDFCGYQFRRLRRQQQSQISNAPDTSTGTEFPDIVPDVFDSKEFIQVFDDLEEEFAAEGILLDEVADHVHTIFIISGEVVAIDDDFDSISAAKYSVSSLSPKGREQVVARLKQPYESGDVIALVFPTADAINDLYTALGEPPMYIDSDELTSSESDDLYPEIYAIAKRYNGESAHYFSYIIPDSKALLKSVLEKTFSKELSNDESVDTPDTTTDDTTSDEYDNLRGDYVFQARRYAAFYRWAAHIDDEMEEQKEFVSSQLVEKAAAVGLVNLFNYSSQRVSVNFDYYKADENWPYWGKHALSYSAGVNDTIYSFHNFGDKNDYYFVMSDSFVKPDFDKKTVGNNIYTVGSMRKFSYKHTLKNVNYSVFNNAPANVNRSTSRTDGTNYSTSAKVGVKLGAKVGVGSSGLSGEISSELSAELAEGAGWKHSATWSTSEWGLTNQCNNKEAKWLVDFSDPDNDGYYPDWNNGDVVKASKNRVDYASEWMWQVTQPSPKIAMGIALYKEVRDTILRKNKNKNDETRGNSYWHFTSSRGPIKLNQPPHIICTAGNSHVLDKNGGNNLVFKFLCSGNWTITSDQSWCYVADESKSGAGTGVNERSMFFYVDPYDTGSDTKAHNRRATITIKDSETGQIQTIDVLQSNR